MNYSQLVADIQANAQRTDSGATASAQKSADKTQRLIEAEGNWYWMQAVESAPTRSADPTDRILLPANWKELREPLQWYETGATPADKTRHPMFTASEAEANAKYDVGDKGDPFLYRIWKGMIYIYPPARDTQRTIRLPYWAWSDPLTGTDSNELSTRWPDLWIARGTAEYLKSFSRDIKGAMSWMGDPRSPQPGTYFYELMKLKRVNARRNLPVTLGARTNVNPSGTPFRRLDYPFWGR